MRRLSPASPSASMRWSAPGAVVTRDVPDFAIVYGNPARPRGWACHCGVTLRFDADASAVGPSPQEDTAREDRFAQCAACGSRYRLQDRGVSMLEMLMPGACRSISDERRVTSNEGHGETSAPCRPQPSLLLTRCGSDGACDDPVEFGPISARKRLRRWWAHSAAAIFAATVPRRAAWSDGSRIGWASLASSSPPPAPTPWSWR